MEKIHMHHKRIGKKHILILFFSLFILMGGLILTLNQTQIRQDQRSLAAGDCTVDETQLQTKPQEQALFDLINAYRTQNGLPVLSWSPALRRPAAWLSADMSRTRNLSHTDSLGRLPETRLPDCGFPLSTSYGENIANGDATAQSILDAWKTSPPHNQIMLSASYTQGAIAMELDTTGVAYWTLDVGGTFNTNPTTTINPTSGTNPTIAVTSALSPMPSDMITPTKGSSNGKLPTPTLGPEGVDVQLSVRVKISGIGRDGNVTPKNLTRKVSAAIYGLGEAPVTTGNAFLTYDGQDYFSGIIRLGKLTQGVYLVKLSTDNSLQTLARPEFQTIMIDRVNEIPAVMLYPGDMNRDNVLNLADYNEVLPCFQNKKCDTATVIDFNDDSTTDVKDYNLFLRSFSQQPGN